VSGLIQPQWPIQVEQGGRVWSTPGRMGAVHRPFRFTVDAGSHRLMRCVLLLTPPHETTGQGEDVAAV
jgi:hypothetical protein